MRSPKKIAIEVLIITVIACILLVPIHYAIVGKLPSPKEQGFYAMFIGSAILVSSIHIIFELLGWNEKWCLNEYKINDKI